MSDGGGRSDFTMREPCRACGWGTGRIIEVGAQDTVRCARCNAWVYNAPRVETGKAVRSVTTVHNGIKPKQRARILERDGNRCVHCGKGADVCVLHVGHFVSVKAGLALGFTEADINAEENLVAECDECNLGRGDETPPIRVHLMIMRARLALARLREGT